MTESSFDETKNKPYDQDNSNKNPWHFLKEITGSAEAQRKRERVKATLQSIIQRLDELKAVATYIFYDKPNTEGEFSQMIFPQLTRDILQSIFSEYASSGKIKNSDIDIIYKALHFIVSGEDEFWPELNNRSALGMLETYLPLVLKKLTPELVTDMIDDHLSVDYNQKEIKNYIGLIKGYNRAVITNDRFTYSKTIANPAQITIISPELEKKPREEKWILVRFNASSMKFHFEESDTGEDGTLILDVKSRNFDDLNLGDVQAFLAQREHVDSAQLEIYHVDPDRKMLAIRIKPN